ncbi:hypothetical protein [Microbispora rosea]|uniref:hypothetical protein n=1 Tax=Microbispora rosea TaxID=58117 RepID=UPI0034183B70
MYGFIRAASTGWRDGVTAGSFAVALALLAVFLVVQVPMTLGTFATSRLAPRLLPRTGAGPLVVAAAFRLSRLDAATPYAPHLLLPILIRLTRAARVGGAADLSPRIPAPRRDDQVV